MAHVDPITFEVVRNALLNAAAEMKVVVMRSSYSTIWRESGDLSCALLSRDAEMIAQGPGDLPAHLATMPFSLHGALDKIPIDSLEPGDVLFHNDPQWGNNHLPDCVMAKPIFVDGEIIGFSGVRGHWTDIGGMGAGSYTAVTTDPIQEGLRIPPVKLYRRGEMDQSYVDFILANVRVPRDRLGDIRAQFAGCVTGERKLLALAAKYGRQTIVDCMNDILDHGEQLTRAELEQIPDGTYHYTDYSDGDGVTDEPIKIQVAVTVSGSNISVDFTGSHPQTIGGMNCPLAVTYSSVQYAVKAAADPWNPANSGCYRTVYVTAPTGTVVNPILPASVVAGNHETAMIIVSAMFGALSQAAPERVISAGSDSSAVTVIGGVDPRPERRGRKYVYIEIQGSAWGATHRGDGVNVMRAGVGNTGNQPIEVVETEYPVTVLEYSMVPDRSGAGKHRGGVPMRRVTRLDGDAQITLIAERGRIAPFGLEDGQPGGLGEYLINPGSDREEKLFSKTAPIERQQGEVLSVCAAGGGGFGPPSERDPEQIRRDVEAGFLSAEAAERDYGVRVAQISINRSFICYNVSGFRHVEHVLRKVPLMLRSLTIDNFRGFSHLEMRDLGRVNLLVGMNNCGKTSLLEAIYLLVSRGDLETIYSVADRRGELLPPGIARPPKSDVDIRRFFHNYDLDAGSSFRIIGMTNSRKEILTAQISALSDSSEQKEKSFDDSLDDNALKYYSPYRLSLTWEGRDSIIKRLPVSSDGGVSVDHWLGTSRQLHRNKTENYFVSTNSLSIDTVISLFESTVLTPEEDLVVEALQLIEPTIERLASVGVEQRYASTSPSPLGHRGGMMVKCTGVKSRIPIGSLGDGIWRMLGLILALVRSQGGIVLIDEIDTGLHFSVMLDMWKLVSETAKRLDVQVFATTHSNDCWTSLAEIVREDVSSDSEITIQRIERHKSQAIAFTERKIAIAASRDIEVR